MESRNLQLSCLVVFLILLWGWIRFGSDVNTPIPKIVTKDEEDISRIEIKKEWKNSYFLKIYTGKDLSKFIYLFF